MNILLIVNDSLRRDHVAAYGAPAPWSRPGHDGEPFIRTPNLDRLASQSALFDRCYISSYPTVPCRTDVITGRYGFPFRGWQPLEPTDVVMSEIVARHGGTPVFIFDTPMLGVDSYNFMRGFKSWDFVRGQHADRWSVDPIETTLPALPHKLKSTGAVHLYLRNTAHRASEADWMCAKTMRTTMDWLERNRTRDDFVLWVDMWDPHEPFDAPMFDMERYTDPSFDGDWIIYPNYGRPDYMSAGERNHVRASYAAQVTLADRWMGRLMEKLETLGLDKNTLVIYTTDHGHLFGDHNLQGKPTGPLGKLYEPTARIPLIIRHPDGIGAGKRIGGLVQHPDLLPTMLEALNIPTPDGLHGKSLLPLMRGDTDDVREFAVSGRYSRQMSLSLKGGMMTFRSQASAFDGTAGLTTEGGCITVTTRRWSYVCPARGDGSPELYDLDTDPNQERDLFSTERAVAADLHAKLMGFLQEVGTAEDRLALYRDQCSDPVKSPLLPEDTPLYALQDEHGQTIAFTERDEAEEALVPALPVDAVRETTLGALRREDPRALILAFEQYYYPEDLG